MSASSPLRFFLASLLASCSVALHSFNSESLHSLSIGVEGGAEGGLLQNSALNSQIFTRRRRMPERQTLDNFHDVHYSASITVGNKEILAIVDTGSYELMVWDSGLSCVGCIGSTASFYNRSQSPTVQMGDWTAEHDFLGGHTFATLARDRVAVGAMQAESQYFWLVHHAVMPGLDLDGFQAILGLAPPGQPVEDALHIAHQAYNFSLEANASGTPDEGLEVWRADSEDFANELRNENTLLEAFEVDTFSVCLEPRLGAPGHITWRDTLPDGAELENAFSLMPVVGHETWTVEMSSATLGDVHLGCDGGCAVVFDTSSPLIAVPQNVFDQVQAALESLDVDCTNIRILPTLSLTLGGTVLTLQPEAYMGEVFGEVSEALSHFWPNPAVGLRTCRPLLMVFDAQTQWGPLWVLGMPFFRSHYTIFHLGQGPDLAAGGIHPEGNIPNRSVYVAQQVGDACERPSGDVPVALWDGSLGMAEQRPSNRRLRRAPVLHVDLAKLHVPRWARAAARSNLKL